MINVNHVSSCLVRLKFVFCQLSNGDFVIECIRKMSERIQDTVRTFGLNKRSIAKHPNSY